MALEIHNNNDQNLNRHNWPRGPRWKLWSKITSVKLLAFIII